MRTVDEWTEDVIRITVFKTNNRFSVKLEKGLLEQNYRFRDGHFESAGELKSTFSGPFLNKIKGIFLQMEKALAETTLPDEQEQFDEII